MIAFAFLFDYCFNRENICNALMNMARYVIYESNDWKYHKITAATAVKISKTAAK